MGGNQTANQMIVKFWLAIWQITILNNFFSFFIIANIKSSKQKGVRCKIVLRPAMISCIYILKNKTCIEYDINKIFSKID